MDSISHSLSFFGPWHPPCVYPQHCKPVAHVCPGTGSRHVHNWELLQGLHSKNKKMSHCKAFESWMCKFCWLIFAHYIFLYDRPLQNVLIFMFDFQIYPVGESCWSTNSNSCHFPVESHSLVWIDFNRSSTFAVAHWYFTFLPLNRQCRYEMIFKTAKKSFTVPSYILFMSIIHPLV